MKIPPSYFLYLALAVVFGIVLSVGINWMTYKPEPLQVPLNQYQPAQAPAPSVPTVAPSIKVTDPFAPAPAPVIVTTEPLPSITPAPAQEQMNLPKCQDSANMLFFNFISSFSWLFMVETGVFFILFTFSGRGTGVMAAVVMIVLGILIFMMMGPITQLVINSIPCVP